MDSCGDIATKGYSWPNFWANLASFSLYGWHAAAERGGTARETPGATVVVPSTPLDLTSLASCRAFGEAMVCRVRWLYLVSMRICLESADPKRFWGLV